MTPWRADAADGGRYSALLVVDHIHVLPLTSLPSIITDQVNANGLRPLRTSEKSLMAAHRKAPRP